MFLTETDNSQNSCFSSKQPSWVLSLNTDPPTHQAPRHHYFRGNSDRRLNIIPLKNRSVYLVICCAIRLQSNYNGAELLDNYELLPGERFRVNIDPQRQSLGIHGRLVISTVLSSIARANCVAEYKNANSVEKLCCTFVGGDKDLVLFLCFLISAS